MPLPSTTTPHVLDAIRDHGPVTAKDLQRITGFSRRTIYSATRGLIESGMVLREVTLEDTRMHLHRIAPEYEECPPRLGQR